MTSQISLDEYECIKNGKLMYQKNVPVPLEDLIIFRKKPGRHMKTLLVLIADTEANYNQKQLAEKLGVSRTTIKRYTENLEKKGLVAHKRIGHNNFYKLTFKGRKLLEVMYQNIAPYDTHSKATVYKTIRSHEIRWKIPILRMPYNKNAFEMDLLQGGMIKGKVPEDKLGWSQYRGYLGNEEYHLGWWYFTPSNLIITIREVYCEDPYDAIDMTFKFVQEFIKKLEEYPPYYGLRLGSVDYVAKLIHRHHAIPDDEFAKLCVAHHIHIKTDRIIIDASHKPELETYARSAEEDILKYRDFVQEIIETTPQFKPSLLTKSIENMGNLFQEVKELKHTVQEVVVATKESMQALASLHREVGYMITGNINFQQAVKAYADKKEMEKLETLEVGREDKTFLLIKNSIKTLKKPTFKNLYKVFKNRYDFVQLITLLNHYVAKGELIYKNGVYRVKDS